MEPIYDIPGLYATDEEVEAKMIPINVALDECKSKFSNYYTKEEIDQFLASCGTGYIIGANYDQLSSKLTLINSDGSVIEVVIRDRPGNTSITKNVYASCDHQPATPVGGDINWSLMALILPTSSDCIWSEGRSLDGDIYMSQCTFVSDGTNTGWSEPMLISGNKSTTEHINLSASHIEVAYHVGGEKVVDSSYLTSVAPSIPVGGTYDFSSKSMTQMPHSKDDENDLWVSEPDYTQTVTDPYTKDEYGNATTVQRTWYFSLGTIGEGDDKFVWTEPAVYGTDYINIASSMKFVSINYDVLSKYINFKSDDFKAIVEGAIDLTSLGATIRLDEDGLKSVAKNISLESLNYSLLAENIDLGKIKEDGLFTSKLASMAALQVEIKSDSTLISSQNINFEGVTKINDNFVVDSSGNVIMNDVVIHNAKLEGHLYNSFQNVDGTTQRFIANFDKNGKRTLEAVDEPTSVAKRVSDYHVDDNTISNPSDDYTRIGDIPTYAIDDCFYLFTGHQMIILPAAERYEGAQVTLYNPNFNFDNENLSDENFTYIRAFDQFGHGAMIYGQDLSAKCKLASANDNGWPGRYGLYVKCVGASVIKFRGGLLLFVCAKNHIEGDGDEEAYDEYIWMLVNNSAEELNWCNDSYVWYLPKIENSTQENYWRYQDGSTSAQSGYYLNDNYATGAFSGFSLNDKQIRIVGCIPKHQQNWKGFTYDGARSSRLSPNSVTEPALADGAEQNRTRKTDSDLMHQPLGFTILKGDNTVFESWSNAFITKYSMLNSYDYTYIKKDGEYTDPVYSRAAMFNDTYDEDTNTWYRTGEGKYWDEFTKSWKPISEINGNQELSDN